jgi:hypothetical protein
MNLVARQDRVLLGGLAVALIVVFARPIRYLLDLAREVEQTSGLALIPALIILTAVFLFHQQGKRQEAKARAASAEAQLLQAGTRASEMEQLVNFGHALGRSLDLDTIRDVVAQHLSRVAQSEDAWVLLRHGADWEALAGTPRESRREIERTRVQCADRAFLAEGAWKEDALSADGHLCVPLTAGGHPVGVLGIPESAGPFTEGRQRVLAMAAALLAISLRNAQLFDELRENSLRDGLTGCFNRTHALDVIDTELRRARRSLMPVSLIMFDIDRFKDVNDHHGHLCGDAVLAAVGGKMREVLRGSDLKCRRRRSKARSAWRTPCDGSSRTCRSSGRARRST